MRTFGWIQNPSSTTNLKSVVGLFVKNSASYNKLINETLPLLKKYNLIEIDIDFDSYIELLKTDKTELPYAILKGKGCNGKARNQAKCSGLVQALISAQKNITLSNGNEKITIKKPYTDDWTADSFLRWAIAIGFLKYDIKTDTCSITDLGTRFVRANNADIEKEILGEAYLSYPPVTRVLSLLKENGHLTKFEIGNQLGFIGEAGFTSISQNIWVASYVTATTEDERTELRSNVEGSSDKYARMICKWLIRLGWIIVAPKTVTVSYGGKNYKCKINQAYEITAQGLKNLKKSFGTSKAKRIPKIVYLGMLATKAIDKDYVRLRRAHILKYLANGEKNLTAIQDFLKSKNIEEDCSCIKDDIEGFKRIGLSLSKTHKGYKLMDKICALEIPLAKQASKSDISVIKSRVCNNLKTINHKYLTLIDLAFGGTASAKEFEIQTIDLLTNELEYQGKRLGNSRKPDGVIYYANSGVIIDNKAYSKGYTIPRSQADEMIRYLQENIVRSAERNHNKWWEVFPKDITQFYYLFISSIFTGKINERLKEIKASTEVNGSVISVENLLYLAEKLKSNEITYEQTFDYFGNNTEILLQ